MSHAPITGATAGGRRVRPPVVPGRFDLVAIAASAGGVEAISTVLAALPANFPVPIAVVLHRTTKPPNLQAEVLGRHTRLAVKTVEASEALRPGMVYLAPPDLRLTVRPDRTVGLTNGRWIRHVLSFANPLFASAAEVLGGRLIAVVLTGSDREATDGVQAVRASGGLVLAQDETTSAFFDMPRSAIQTGCVDQVLPLAGIAPTLVELVTDPAPDESSHQPVVGDEMTGERRPVFPRRVLPSGVAATLTKSTDLRDALGLAKVPHVSTLAYAADPLRKRGASTPSEQPYAPMPALSV